MPNAPSWPSIIVSGLTGGLVNAVLDSHLPGILVFALMSAALMYIE